MATPTCITVKASGTYDILLTKGGLARIGETLSERFKPCTIAILSDDKVFPLYGKTVTDSLEAAGFRTVCHVIPNGEQSKTLESVTGFIGRMVESQVTRTDMALALGGGVIGDMAGFAAAIYLRGIPYIQVPTTLLAAVDSSVGGKTAVDISAGKNLVGAFHQPALVYLDTDTLSTLDPQVMRDGFAEVIKYGVILDRRLFDTVAVPGTFDLKEVIARCIEIKRDVVEADEFDRGMRGLLNFGHTSIFGDFMPKKKKKKRVTVKEAIKLYSEEEAARLIDEDSVVAEGVRRAEQEGIIFIDEIDKIASKGKTGGADVSREGVQRDILPIVEGSTVVTKYGTVKTDYILFIAAGAFHIAAVEDLIPELQGRFPIIVELQSLTKEDFIKILTVPKNALTKQYATLLSVDNINLSFADDAIEEIAEMCVEMNATQEDIGARRLHTIMENLLEDISFNADGTHPIIDLVIDKKYVDEHLSEAVERRNLKKFIL